MLFTETTTDGFNFWCFYFYEKYDCLPKNMKWLIPDPTKRAVVVHGREWDNVKPTDFYCRGVIIQTNANSDNIVVDGVKILITMIEELYHDDPIVLGQCQIFSKLIAEQPDDDSPFNLKAVIKRFFQTVKFINKKEPFMEQYYVTFD